MTLEKIIQKVDEKEMDLIASESTYIQFTLCGTRCRIKRQGLEFPAQLLYSVRSLNWLDMPDADAMCAYINRFKF